MLAYSVRRLGQGLVVVVVVSLITFLEVHLLPGSPGRAILGSRATAAQINAFNKANGFNLPLPVQYLRYMDRLIHGNLGFSYQLNQSVSQLLAERLPATVLLVGLSVVVAIIVAIPVAVVQAVRRGRVVDHILTGTSFVLYSMPTFWLGLVLIVFFAVKLGWLPPAAPSGSFGQVVTHPIGLVLPVLTLALVTIAVFTRYLRSSLLDNLTEDYVTTARAKGVKERGVLYRHVFRNALAPLITLLGLSLPGILGGALITESVFNYPGMGLLFWNSAQTQDYAVLLGVTIVVAVGTVVGSLIADLLYAAVDPRVRYDRR